jgi:hypothetical protein
MNHGISDYFYSLGYSIQHACSCEQCYDIEMLIADEENQ